jgi:L,D-peptidoglycan transpeptidase YkuD (ErfK/YbiS/YcfS/YnhG family)
VGVRVLAIAASWAAALTAPCPGAVNQLPGTQAATQLVTVTATAYGTTTASLELWQKRAGCWRRVAGPWRAWLGGSGLSTHKREGDGATPAGTYRFGSTDYGIAANPGVHTAYHRLVCGDWWDEDASSPAYNTFQHVACGMQPPFGAGSEALWRISPQYRYLTVIEYNAHPVVRGRGSAIFLHVSAGHPTAGCVSLPEAQLVRVLRWLRPSARPLIHLGVSG